MPLIEDAACAIGSEILWKDRWERIGAPHGDVACFSFHPRKVISTGDGGMITTRHADWDKQFRLLRQHAMSVPDTVRHGAAQVIFEQYDSVGYNYRMTDIQAAVGREQLKRLRESVRRRRELAARYRELLRDLPSVAAPAEPANGRTNWQSYCVRLAEGVDQRAVMQAHARRRGQYTSRHHVQPSRTCLRARAFASCARAVGAGARPLRAAASFSGHEHRAGAGRCSLVRGLSAAQAIPLAAPRARRPLRRSAASGC